MYPKCLVFQFFICGLLYILSERNPSKKMVSVCLAIVFHCEWERHNFENYCVLTTTVFVYSVWCLVYMFVSWFDCSQITASLALSIISVIGVLSALVDFSRAIVGIHHVLDAHMYENYTEEEELYAEQHYVRIFILIIKWKSWLGGI